MKLTNEQCKSVLKYTYKGEDIPEFTCDGVNKILNTLPESRQTLVKLRFVEGLTYKQIREKIGISTTTIMQRLSLSTSVLRHPSMQELIRGDKTTVVEASSHIDIMTLSVRTRNALLRANISTIDALVQYTPEQLMGIRNLGSSSIKEIENILNLHGMKLS